MALAKVGAQSVMGPLLPRVADQIKEAISVKGRTRPNCPEALQCVGVLAQALGSTWRNEATSLVQPMMSTGLSQPLVKTLQVICLCFTDIWPCSVGFDDHWALAASNPNPIGNLPKAQGRFGQTESEHQNVIAEPQHLLPGNHNQCQKCIWQGQQGLE